MSCVDLTPELVDTHAHLDDRRLHPQIEAVLDRASHAGVRQVIAIGTTTEDSPRVLALAEAYPGLFAAVGIHPNEAANATDADWKSITQLASRKHVVAIGETGLDRHWKDTPFDLQRAWFDRHLELARRLDLPVVIHCRDAQRDLIEHLSALNRPVRGVMHSFTGTWDDAQAFLAMGLDLSFAGMISFTNKNLDTLREVAARTPADRIMVETDSPYLTPHPYRGQTNEPARVAVTAARLAEIRGISLADLAALTTANARRLFRLPPDRTLG